MDRLKILVTDDETGMRLAVERALRDFTVRVPDVGAEVGFEVEQAESGEQALDRIAACPPDILLLDHKLSGISGLEVLDRVAALHGDTLTVMITAYASIETAVTATKRGAYDFLAKPFTPEELKGTIRKAAIRVVLARQARRLAEERRQVRFQFISVLGHELKAPLNAIDGYLQLMKARTAGDDLTAYDSMIDRTLVRVEHMRKLIADLLDMTRIESGQKSREIAEVDVAAAARAAMETMAPEAAGRGIVMELHAAGPVTLAADAGEIAMILNNLVSNAVKYNRDGGRVDIDVSRSAGRVTIRVRDTGIGLTPEQASRLFNEFVRIRTEQTRNILGSGLGLSIVRKLAAMYGGDATVESRAGEGSTFTVVLCDARPQALPEQAPASPEN